MSAGDTVVPTFSMLPGDKIKRTLLHRQFGGRRQGGISPSRVTPNVFLFSDPKTGRQHGYIDGWADDGFYHYTGEGQRGDQQMIQGNRATLNHLLDKRKLHLFSGTGGVVTYVGEFELLNDSHYLKKAPQSGGGSARDVIVFRLAPVGEVLRQI